MSRTAISFVAIHALSKVPFFNPYDWPLLHYNYKYRCGHCELLLNKTTDDCDGRNSCWPLHVARPFWLAAKNIRRFSQRNLNNSDDFYRYIYIFFFNHYEIALFKNVCSYSLYLKLLIILISRTHFIINLKLKTFIKKKKKWKNKRHYCQSITFFLIVL